MSSQLELNLVVMYLRSLRRGRGEKPASSFTEFQSSTLVTRRIGRTEISEVCSNYLT